MILEIHMKNRIIGIVIVTKALAALEFGKVTFAINVEDVFLAGFIKFQRTSFFVYAF